MKLFWTKIVRSMDVMLITKFNITLDADHRNSLSCTLRVAYHFLRPRLGISDPTFLAEKCYDNDHEDIRSVLDFRAATGGIVCTGTNGRQRSDQNRDG
jgi:hypothetical protein